MVGHPPKNLGAVQLTNQICIALFVLPLFHLFIGNLGSFITKSLNYLCESMAVERDPCGANEDFAHEKWVTSERPN